jgi:hypothetical protein
MYEKAIKKGRFTDSLSDSLIHCTIHCTMQAVSSGQRRENAALRGQVLMYEKAIKKGRFTDSLSDSLIHCTIHCTMQAVSSGQRRENAALRGQVLMYEKAIKKGDEVQVEEILNAKNLALEEQLVGQARLVEVLRGKVGQTPPSSHCSSLIGNFPPMVFRISN